MRQQDSGHRLRRQEPSQPGLLANGKFYISGPMTGLPDSNYPAFNTLAEKLRKLGYDIVTPVEACAPLTAGSWSDFMRVNIAVLVGCGGIVTLPGWRESKGARLEMEIAQALDFKVLHAAEMGWS